MGRWLGQQDLINDAPAVWSILQIIKIYNISIYIIMGRLLAPGHWQTFLFNKFGLIYIIKLGGLKLSTQWVGSEGWYIYIYFDLIDKQD